jgi:hypothetical protein
MYSALYAAECQEKRLLILAITILKVTRGVKNLSYWLPSFTKKLSPRPPGTAERARFGATDIPGNYRSFSQNGKFVLEIRRCSGYDQLASGSTAPDEMGRFPQIVFQKNRISKIRFFRCS